MASYIGAFLGMLSVVLGAFGAHALKKKFNLEQQQSFETGVRYQMYHSLALLLVGRLPDSFPHLAIITQLYIWGILLFSFSIYGLCLSGAFGTKWRFLGPITPLGGLLLVAAWGLLFYGFL